GRTARRAGRGAASGPGLAGQPGPTPPALRAGVHHRPGLGSHHDRVPARPPRRPGAGWGPARRSATFEGRPAGSLLEERSDAGPRVLGAEDVDERPALKVESGLEVPVE